MRKSDALVFWNIFRAATIELKAGATGTAATHLH